MAIDAKRGDLVAAVVGTGAMGRGIAQIAARAGVRVLLHDAKPDAAAEARQSIAAVFDALVAKGKLDAARRDEALARLAVVGELGSLAGAHIVIEAIVEDLPAKRALFRALEASIARDAILATNTSSLSVTAIAAACEKPGRVAGFHFFNPVPLMKLVEVVDGLLTEPWVSEALMDLANRMGHTAVRAADTPGFIVNHAGRGYGTEALRIVGEGVADFATVDRILREAAGFRMGPFELLDLTGLDVSHPVMESIYRQYYEEPRFRPSPLTRLRVAAGLLGRKSGRGFYDYADGKQIVPAEPPAPDARPRRVWISAARPAARAMAVDVVRAVNGRLDEGARPAADALCVVLPLGRDATAAALAEDLDARRTVALDMLYPLARRRTVMTTPITAPDMRAAAHGLFAADGAAVSVIRDSPGFVAQRVAATIVNIGCDIAQQRIAAPADIDRAVTLGLGYPKGPLALGDALGAANILTVLRSLLETTGDPRYRPSLWLARRAALGVSLLTAED